MNRRQFLAAGAAVVGALALDPERLLWVPGAKTIFLPSETLVEATSMDDALSQGFVAVFPDGARMDVRVRAGLGMTLDERLAHERADVRRMGGRIVENRQYTRHAV